MDMMVLNNFPFWEQLTSDEKRIMESHAKTIHFDKGQLISTTDMDCLGILYILKGIIRIYLYTEEGREATIARLADDEICLLSASCLLSPVIFQAQLAAEEDLDAVLIPSKILSDVMKQNIYVENFVYRSTIERFSDVISAIQQMLFSPLDQRISAFLLDESARLGTDTLNLTQEKLAQNIGSAREAVTRALKQLASCECIEVFRGGIKIKNRKRLYEIISKKQKIE